MKLAIVILSILLVSLCQSKVVPAKDEADIYRINDLYPARYSVIIFIGANPSFWDSIGGVFGKTKFQQQQEELEEIIEFFEDEPHYEIPIIEVNVDKGNFTGAMKKFGVKQVPWIVILDENNDISYSKEPIEEADEEILLVMSIFPSTIMLPPAAGDSIVFDDDDEPDDEIMDWSDEDDYELEDIETDDVQMRPNMFMEDNGLEASPVIEPVPVSTTPVKETSETVIKTTPSTDRNYR